MVVIRLRRAGSKKRPFFRVVVADSRAARDSSFVEILGSYNPRAKPAIVDVDTEKLKGWIAKGAQPSDSVRTLIARHLTPKPVAAEPASTNAAALAPAAPAPEAPAATPAPSTPPAPEAAAPEAPASASP